MELYLKRFELGDKYTVGKLFTEEKYLSFVLEDKERGLTSDMSLERIKEVKILGRTAIPEGRYRVVMLWSEKHKMVIPHILNVPCFNFIEIHWGNTDLDTDGCLLTARTHPLNTDFVGDSRKCFMEDILPLISQACSKESVFITIQKMAA